MKIISVGKNTKNAEGIKIPGEVKKAFTKYLKAQQFLHAEEYEKVSVELLFVSWLATFVESEDFKTITEEAEKRKEENKEARKEEQEEKKAAAKSTVCAMRLWLALATAPKMAIWSPLAQPLALTL